MADQPLRSQFFVVRENDTMVPLVALDELPDHIEIKNVPRTLTVRDIQGMTCVGNFEARHLKHSVVNRNQSPNTPLGSVGTMQPAQESTVSLPASSRQFSSDTFPSQTTPFTSGHDQSFTDTLSSKPIPQSGGCFSLGRQDLESAPIDYLNPEEVALILANPGIKRYCSHWLKTGNCDFTQQGCLYKHLLPSHLAVLMSTGFRDIPPWFRQKYGVGSYLAVEGADASFSSSDLRSVVASGKTPRSGRTMSSWRGASLGVSAIETPSRTKTGAGSGEGASRRPLPLKSRPNAATSNSSQKKLRPTDIAAEGRRPSDVLSISDLEKKIEAGRRGSAALQKSKHAATSGSDLDADGSASFSPEDMDAGDSNDGTALPPHPTTAISRSRPRRQSTASSLYSDIEADIAREEAERKAKEDAHVATLESERKKIVAVEIAKSGLDRKMGEKSSGAAASGSTTTTTTDARINEGAHGRRSGRGGKGRYGGRRHQKRD